MNAHKASLINAILLVALGAWGYFSSVTPSPTALIPVGFGVILLALSGGIKKENKVIAHIAVVLTFLVALGLAMAFKGTISRGNTLGMVRVGIMIISTIVAIVYFVKSFRDARIARENAA